MATKSKSVKVAVPVTKVVQSEDEEQEETEEVTNTVTTDTGVPGKIRARTAQEYYDNLVIINDMINAADPAVQDGVKGTLIFISNEEHEVIKNLIQKFDNSGPKPKTDVSDKIPSYRTINLSAKKYEKDLEFVKAYMNTKEYTNVFLPVAGQPLYTQKEGAEPVFTHEISKNWKTDVKYYMSAEKYPELHRMLQEKTDSDNVPIKKSRNDWAVANNGANRIGGKIVSYSKSDKNEYRVWDEVNANWGTPMKQQKAASSSAAVKPRPKKG